MERTARFIRLAKIRIRILNVYIIIIIFPLRDRRWAQQKFSVTYQEVRLWGGYVDG